MPCCRLLTFFQNELLTNLSLSNGFDDARSGPTLCRPDLGSNCLRLSTDGNNRRYQGK